MRELKLLCAAYCIATFTLLADRAVCSTDRWASPLGTTDGSCKTIENACTIDRAAAQANIGDQIWLTNGTFTLSQANGSVTLKENVTLLGASSSVLTCPASPSDPPLFLPALTVTGGGAYSWRQIQKITVRNCLAGALAVSGGARAIVSNCTFQNTTAAPQPWTDGYISTSPAVLWTRWPEDQPRCWHATSGLSCSAVKVTSGARLELSDVTFEDNQAGGLLVNPTNADGSTPDISSSVTCSHCSFVRNQYYERAWLNDANGYIGGGGGLHAGLGAEVTLSDSLFDSNSARCERAPGVPVTVAGAGSQVALHSCRPGLLSTSAESTSATILSISTTSSKGWVAVSTLGLRLGWEVLRLSHMSLSLCVCSSSI